MASRYYTQFATGHDWGSSFVRLAGLEIDYDPATHFFYDEDGNIVIREYYYAYEFESMAPFEPSYGLLWDLRYNINTDVLNYYEWADIEPGFEFEGPNPPLGFDFENMVVLGPEDNTGPGGDVLRFDNLNDYIDAGAGNDKIYAVGGKHNLIYGREGNDELSASWGHDVIFGNEGDDYIHGGSGTDSLFGGEGVDVIYGGPGHDVISGGLGDDILRGGWGHDIIIDLDGNNNIYGNSGDDFIITGDGDDEIYGNEGSDIIHAGDGDDYVNDGTTGDDILFGEGGNDRLYVQQGDDVVYGGDGDDYISASTYGGDLDGDDIFYGQAGSDELKGRGGHDKLFADDPNYEGPAGYDKLRGGDGDDLLVGGDGIDRLYGESGADLLVASPNGQSKMYGGVGEDTFAFLDLPEGKAHRIEDYDFDNDVINISDLLEGYDPGTSDINDFVRIFFRSTERTDIKINADGAGDDWTPVAVVMADFTGTSPGIMLAQGQLVANNNLFDSDWT